MPIPFITPALTNQVYDLENFNNEMLTNELQLPLFLLNIFSFREYTVIKEVLNEA